MAQPYITPFGKTAEGEAVSRIMLRDGNTSCAVITYGGAVTALTVQDRWGKETDVVLGFDTLEDYEKQDKYIGALIGRCANRLGGGSFTLGDKTFRLALNDGHNHLHGGVRGFDKQVWQIEHVTERQATLSLFSPSGDEGYPGNLTVYVTYMLSDNAVSLRYVAMAEEDTLCNLTNHSYFNLAGHDSGSVLSQEIQLFADAYTPTDRESIPHGEIASVEGTPMDLRKAVPIGAGVDADFDQLRWAGGYDHNWVVNGPPGTLRPAAEVYCKETGILLAVETTLPGIQFYTGNYLSGVQPGKGGALYRRRWGFCLETQYFPNAPACPAFIPPLLRAGERYEQTTVLRFSTRPSDKDVLSH